MMPGETAEAGADPVAVGLGDRRMMPRGMGGCRELYEGPDRQVGADRQTWNGYMPLP
jgi:hypothetical protein